MNKPIRVLKNTNGVPLLDDDGKKQYNVSLEHNSNTFPTRKQRRSCLQKSVRNPFYGIHMNKYIQVVPETVKNEEGIITRIGRILNSTKKKFSYTGKVKVIDHFSFIKNRI